MRITGEDIADVVLALEDFESVQRVHMLPPRMDPDAFSIVVVLSPYSISELVRAHYAVVEATGGRALAGRILYVDGGTRSYVPGRPVALTSDERDEARLRVDERKQQAGDDDMFDRQAIDAAFREHVRPAANDNHALAVCFGPTPILEIVPDPFPSERPMRVLVVDDDPATANRIAKLPNVDVIVAEDGWSAVDRLKEGKIDLAVCALKIGEFSGAKIHKLVATANPPMARRIVFLATETAVSQAPPSSASGRVLARPISPDAVRSMLDTLGPVA